TKSPSSSGSIQCSITNVSGVRKFFPYTNSDGIDRDDLSDFHKPLRQSAAFNFGNFATAKLPSRALRKQKTTPGTPAATEETPSGNNENIAMSKKRLWLQKTRCANSEDFF
ncbi:hypothetical protein TNCV_4888841, partial [Trichonephila clavipes]